ncbi:hypothetical protein WJX77_004758 [Trebouxia sp. C0004]
MERTHLHLHTAGCAQTHHPEGTTVLVASILSSDHTTVSTYTDLLTQTVGITIVVLHTHVYLLRGVRLEEVITGTSTGTMVATTQTNARTRATSTTKRTSSSRPPPLHSNNAHWRASLSR